MARIGKYRVKKLGLLKGIPIPHRRLRTGKTLKADVEPSPERLGVGSSSEVKVYLWLRQRKIHFAVQVNFDGGDRALGGQRADFVLWDYRMIVEVLGYWHYTPGQQLRDERKWDRRRRDGWQIVTVDPMAPGWQRTLEGQIGIPVR